MITLPKFESNITSTCTNTCVCCDHYSPFLPVNFVDVKELEGYLLAAKRIMHAGDYRLIGGEPTSHPKLLELLDMAHSTGIADKVTVWTNGMLLKSMPQEFWRKADGITVTVYPKLQHLGWIQDKCRDEHMPLQIVQHGHFNRTFARHACTQAEADAMFRPCIYRSCNEYDNGWFYHCNNAAFIARLVMGLPEGTDGIYLPTATEDEFNAYLNRAQPFESCSHCVQTKLIPVAWHEAKRGDEWYRESEYQG